MGGFWLVCGAALSLGAVELTARASTAVLGEVMGDGAGGVAFAKQC